MLNSNEPRIDPCGTPWGNSFQELNDVFILVLCQRFHKWAILKKVRHFRDQEWEKKLEIYGFQFYFKNTVLKTIDVQVLKNSTLHYKISRLGGGGLLQRLSVKISSNIRYTVTLEKNISRIFWGRLLLPNWEKCWLVM